MRLQILLAGALVGQCAPPDAFRLAEPYRDRALEVRAVALMEQIVAAAPPNLELRARRPWVLVLSGAEFDAICPHIMETGCSKMDGASGPRGRTGPGGIWLFEELHGEHALEETLAHEVTHILHERWPKCRSNQSDCFRAGRAIGEGMARYGERVLDGKTEELTWFVPGDWSVRSRDISEAQLPYAVGDFFFHWLRYTGHLSRLTPDSQPSTTAAMLHPELWLAGWEPSLACDDGIVFGEAWITWHLQGKAPHAEAHTAGVGWDGDCYTRRPGVTEWRSRWATAADAREFEAVAGLGWPKGTARCDGVECIVSWAP